MAKNDGGSFHPKEVLQIPGTESRPGIYTINPGLTMRQYYKAAALQSLIQASGPLTDFKELAEDAGDLADCMISEDEEFSREKPQ